MAPPNSPRKGSLQYWPRKRARKFLPRINWNAIKAKNNQNSKKGLLGFICYKAGMASAFVKDETADSMTKGKKIIIPITILECPPLKIFSTRFYKDGKVAKEVLAESFDKELKKKLKLPKNPKKIELPNERYEEIRVLCYTNVKKTKLKKTPDLSEIALSGNYEDQLNFVKEKIGKEISISEFFQKGELVDFHGLTKGKGLQGPVKRFGITLKSHKSEKGQRKPGAIGSFHPGRVTFYAPMAGQIGMFTRVSYNNKIILIGKENKDKKLKDIKNFGDINTEYLLVHGSVQGPSKRQLILTFPLRETKKQKKKNYEFIELR
jgi:large subunit ribosomal protein L3